MEREALESLFPDEYHAEGPDRFRLELVPGEAENFVRAPLIIQYPPDYPDAAPQVSLNKEIATGMSESKEKALISLIEDTIEQNVGIAMIYTLAETVQEYLRENNVSEVSMHDLMLNRQRGIEGPPAEEEDEEEDEEDAVEEEQGEWKGLEEKVLCSAMERITQQSFMEWKTKFDEELVKLGIIKRDGDERVTGKLIFERQLAENREKGNTDVVDVYADLFDDAELPDEEDFMSDE